MEGFGKKTSVIIMAAILMMSEDGGECRPLDCLALILSLRAQPYARTHAVLFYAFIKSKRLRHFVDACAFCNTTKYFSNV